MCNIDQLQEAFRNVAYGADGTWTSDLCSFQRTNMALYLQERHIRTKTCRWERLTPRTVRDCIPNSKLAQYSNYEYDEARELSYSPMVIRYERLYETFDPDEISEPWMMEEIDDLLIGFLSYKDCPGEIGNCKENHENLPCVKDVYEHTYESPLLEASNFEEMALKLSIVSDNIKKIWDNKYFSYCEWYPVSKGNNLVLFKSPTCQMFPLIDGDGKDRTEDIDVLQDTQNVQDNEVAFSQIKELTQSFKEQNTWIFKKQYATKPWPAHNSVDLSTHRRLYSAVLQGSAHNELPLERNDLVSFQFPPTKTSKTETGTETCDVPNVPSTTARNASSDQGVQMSRNMIDVNSLMFQCNASSQGCPYYNSRTSVQTTPSTSTPLPSVFAAPSTFTNYQYFPQTNSFCTPRVYSNNYVPNTGLLNFRQTGFLPLVLQNATAPYAAHSPFLNFQRGIFHNYGRAMVIPQRPQVIVPNSGWILQPPVKIAQPSVNVLTPRPPVHAPSYQYRAACTGKPRFPKTPSVASSSAKVFPTLPKEDSIDQDMENIVAKTVSAVLDDSDPFVPVTGTPSDELELQALEQYSPSNDSVFQELERQAAEQYETSENWKNPPKCDDRLFTFGGFSRFELVRFRCMEEILELGRTFKNEIQKLVTGY